MEERISDTEERNLKITKMEEKRDLRIKIIKELYEKCLTPPERTI